MINSHLLVSGAEYFANDAEINPYYKPETIDREVASAEHATIVDCFRQASISITQVAPPADCQDGVYTANWALVHHGTAIMSRLPEVRRPEQQYAYDILTNLGIRCIIPPSPYLFSGQGDSLVCGDFLFAGSGYRSDREAQQFTADTLGLQLIQLQTIPQLVDGKPHTNPITQHADSFFYDLDLALSIIDDHTIAYCPDAFTAPSQRLLRDLPIDKILVSLAEAQQGFACNLVSTGETVIMSAHAPELTGELQKRNLKILQPEITELKKGGGYIRCVSLSLS